jgi:plasminogen activator inhibitor 1 RNA-binding protein
LLIEPLRATGYDLRTWHDEEFSYLSRILGNTSDQDSDREPEPPTKAIDKPTARSGKRDAPKEAPTAPAGRGDGSGRGGRGRGDRRGGFNNDENCA